MSNLTFFFVFNRLRNSFHPPCRIIPVTTLVGSHAPVEEIDEEIMLSLISLGWSNNEVFLIS